MKDRRVNKSQGQLAQAERLESLGQLAGGVAHDFNNLLAVILNYAAFVSEELAAVTESDWAGRCASARDDLAQITLAGERAASLTRQLLAFARREVVRPQVLDLDTVITAVEELLRRTLGEHVELVTSLAGDLWPVLADPGQLEQVLVNLAVNARDAMPGGGSLTIDTSNVTVDAESIAGGLASRRRDGTCGCGSATPAPGCPPDVIEHAFEPFFTTKADGAGTGLGLATVYGILTQADGHIHIYSEPGAGTTFSIMLPVTAEAAAPRRQSRDLPADAQGRDRPGRRGRGSPARGDPADLRPQRLPGDHRRERPGSPRHRRQPPGRDPPARHRRRHAAHARQGGRREDAAIKPGIEVLYMSGYARPVLASQGRLDPGVALVEKPFSAADLLAKAGQVLNGHFRGFKTTPGATRLTAGTRAPKTRE